MEIAETVLFPELATYTVEASAVATKLGAEPVGKVIVVTGVGLVGEKDITVSSPLSAT
jgi:hypothetical protein